MGVSDCIVLGLYYQSNVTGLRNRLEGCKNICEPENKLYFESQIKFGLKWLRKI